VVHRLEPSSGDPTFHLGTWFHRALEEYYLLIDSYTHAIAAQEARDAYEAIADDTFASVGRDLGVAWVYALPDFQDARDLGVAMLDQYLEWEETNPLVDEVVAVEQRVEIPIRSPGGRRVGILSVQTDLVGRREGRLVVVDHKTAKSRPSSGHLDIDDQLTAEVVSWWVHSGEFPEEAIYNVALKRRAEPPRVLANGTLSKDKRQSTTVRLYEEEIQRLGLAVAPYRDILAYLADREATGEGALVVREHTFRSPGQVDAFQRDLYQEWRDMSAVAAHPERAYPSPDRMECPRCPVRSICFTMQDDGDVEGAILADYIVGDPRR
jgi:hypothetical protein